MNVEGKPPVELVVVDLDNTLYDWIGIFVPSLYEMVRVAAEILDVTTEQILDELRTVHRRHSDSEHPFALLETVSVAARFRGDAQAAMRTLDPAFHAFNRARKKSLRLYDGVEETLEEIVARGAVIVAYTDARVASALFRIGKLRLDRYLSRLYTPAGRHTAADADAAFVHILGSEDRKPNASVLQHICESFSIAPERTLYVGDSLTRDIQMAKAAGCRAAWARYGTRVDASLGAMLLRVSHWTEQDVERERALKSDAVDVRADCILDGFAELLEHFEIGTRVAAGLGFRRFGPN